MHLALVTLCQSQEAEKETEAGTQLTFSNLFSLELQARGGVTTI